MLSFINAIASGAAAQLMSANGNAIIDYTRASFTTATNLFIDKNKLLKTTQDMRLFLLSNKETKTDLAATDIQAISVERTARFKQASKDYNLYCLILKNQLQVKIEQLKKIDCPKIFNNWLQIKESLTLHIVNQLQEDFLYKKENLNIVIEKQILSIIYQENKDLIAKLQQNIEDQQCYQGVKNTILSYAICRNKDLSNLNFGISDLSYTDFSYSNFYETILSNNIKGANFTGSILLGAIITDKSQNNKGLTDKELKLFLMQNSTTLVNTIITIDDAIEYIIKQVNNPQNINDLIYLTTVLKHAKFYLEKYECEYKATKIKNFNDTITLLKSSQHDFDHLRIELSEKTNMIKELEEALQADEISTSAKKIDQDQAKLSNLTNENKNLKTQLTKLLTENNQKDEKKEELDDFTAITKTLDNSVTEEQPAPSSKLKNTKINPTSKKVGRQKSK